MLGIVVGRTRLYLGLSIWGSPEFMNGSLGRTSVDPTKGPPVPCSPALRPSTRSQWFWFWFRPKGPDLKGRDIIAVSRVSTWVRPRVHRASSMMSLTKTVMGDMRHSCRSRETWRVSTNRLFIPWDKSRQGTPFLDLDYVVLSPLHSKY